jgi:hypothetical protein
MKKLSVLTLVVFIFGVSCKKADYVQQNHPIATSTISKKDTSAGWRPLTNWSTRHYDKSTLFSSKVQDSLITESVVARGLVLAYKKTGTTIHALPYRQSENGISYFWIYQVTKGQLQVSCHVSDSTVTAPALDHSIVYFVIAPQQLTSLGAKGNSKASLMRLSYGAAMALLKN